MLSTASHVVSFRLEVEARPRWFGDRDQTQLDTGSTKARVRGRFRLNGLANHLKTQGRAQDGLTNAISGKESNRYARQVMDGCFGLVCGDLDRR